MRTKYPVEFFIDINRIAISIKPSEIGLAGLVRSESDLYFLGLKLESCEDTFERAANGLRRILTDPAVRGILRGPSTIL